MNITNQSLYELTGDFLTLMNMLYDENVDEESLLDACEHIEAQIEDKADGYAKIIKGLEVNANGIKAEEKRLRERREKLEKRVDFLKHNLEGSMRAMGKTKFKTDLFSFGIRKNPASVKIAEPAAFIERCQKDGRDDLLRFKDPEINRTAVKNAILKDGEVIDGAEVVQTEGLQIR
jgi:phage host-nuclease inhibitor protein Gam